MAIGNDDATRAAGAKAAAEIEAEGRRLGAEWLASSVLAVLIEASPDRKAAIKELTTRQAEHLRRLVDETGKQADGNVIAMAVAVAAAQTFRDTLKRAVDLAAVSAFGEGTGGTRN